jgi:hypothetical protein
MWGIGEQDPTNFLNSNSDYRPVRITQNHNDLVA